MINVAKPIWWENVDFRISYSELHRSDSTWRGSSTVIEVGESISDIANNYLCLMPRDRELFWNLSEMR